MIPYMYNYQQIPFSIFVQHCTLFWISFLCMGDDRITKQHLVVKARERKIKQFCKGHKILSCIQQINAKGLQYGINNFISRELQAMFALNVKSN